MNDETTATATCFDYQAQTREGQPLSGSIDAADVNEARWKLESLGMRIIDLAPSATRDRKTRPVRGDQFIAFNQQLAQLTKAGLPLERGLRLIAQDMHSRKLSAAVTQIAEDLEAGTPLADVFEKRRGQFPAMYGRLVDAGVKSGNLSAVLLSLSSHLELAGQLRAAIWRAVSYPIVVLGAMAGLMCFIGWVVVPPMEEFRQMMVGDFDARLPAISGLTGLLFAVTRGMPWILLAVLLVVLGVFAAWGWYRARGDEQRVTERWLMPLPLLGTVLVKERIARWCDAVRIAVDAGIDLPAAIELAGHASRSPRLIDDGQVMCNILRMGESLENTGHLRMVPSSVVVAMDLGAANNNLSATLATLVDLYQRQAEHRIAVLNAALQPVLLVMVGIMAALVMMGMYGMLAALPSMFQSVMNM